MDFWFTADQHHGHKMIISYCNRPFKSIEEMDSELIKRWNSRVKQEDTVFVIGDFSFRKSASYPEGDSYLHYKKQLNGNIIFLLGNHDCFSEDTRLLTMTGYKNYLKLKVGELIPTLNLNTKTVEFQPIQKIIINPVNEIYGFKNKTGEGKFSFNHELLISACNKKHSNLTIRKKSCKQLWMRKSYFNILVATISNFQDINLSDDWFSLLGWLYTDGSFSANCQSLWLWQSKETYLNEIRSLLTRLNLKYSEKIRNRRITHILGKKLINVLPQHEFYINAKDGRSVRRELDISTKYSIPRWLWFASDRQIRVLKNSMIAGDGAINGSGVEVIWGKKEFLSKIQGLFVTHGINCNLVTTTRGDYYLCLHKREQKLFTKEIDTSKCYIKKNSSLTWCVTVPNHTVFTELNGTPLISGNSHNKLKTIAEKMVVNYGGHRMNLVHNPDHVDTRYEINLVGHVHNKFEIERIRRGESFTDAINVGVDVWSFFPISISEILSRYAKWKKKENIK